MEKAEFLDPEKTLVLFEGYKLNRHLLNKDGSSRWRCEKCKSMSITIDSNQYIKRKPTQGLQHAQGVCEKYNTIQIQRLKKYESLKFVAKSNPKFNFAERYREHLLELQSQHDPAYVAVYYPNKETARVTCSRIRSKLIGSEPTKLDEDIDDISSKKDDLIDDFEPEENDQIFSNVKILKLKNSYKNVDFTDDIESRIKQLQQHRARQANEKDLTVDDAISNVVCNTKIGLKRKAKDIIQETLDTVPVIPNSQIVEVITVDENIQVENVTFLLNHTQWLMGRHIDAAFDEIEKSALFRYINLAIVNNWKMEDCIRQNGFLHESPELDKIYVVNVNNVHWKVLTNIDPQNREPNDCFYNFDNNQWCQQNWYVSTIQIIVKQLQAFFV
ncbi:unnamed protein product [Brachionus calyciflorus]|uniref:Uncharacterized protein n=1 Tax=Brachionus calyciflorus TaxID=104777 RepID=A0A814D2J7_9BILA|nr:unnamed protein product [Brachionus calyciflorus]